MVTISETQDLFTLINVFKVKEGRQDQLVQLLIDATQETMRHQPGFVSANIHISDDGQKVINYAQWESKAHFQQMLHNEEAQPLMKAAEQLVHSFDPMQTQVVDSITNKA
ncbi:MAG: antibiotic biosynthesis monooxygenase family protein [Bacteroidota bacterium]